MMSLAMEMAAIDALKDYLEPGEMTVGAIVNVTHTAATPEGWKVRAEAEVTKRDGRQSSSTCAPRTKRKLSAAERICVRSSIAASSMSASQSKSNRDHNCASDIRGKVIDDDGIVRGQ